MTEIDFDWTDAGSPEDHACKLEEISENAGNRGRYQESTELHVAAQCIRGLADDVERLSSMASRLDAQLGKRPCQNERCLPYADMEAEIEALREALKEIEAEDQSEKHRSTAYMDIEEVAETKGRQGAWEDAADIARQALAAHDKEDE